MCTYVQYNVIQKQNKKEKTLCQKNKKKQIPNLKLYFRVRCYDNDSQPFGVVGKLNRQKKEEMKYQLFRHIKKKI